MPMGFARMHASKHFSLANPWGMNSNSIDNLAPLLFYSPPNCRPFIPSFWIISIQNLLSSNSNSHSHSENPLINLGQFGIMSYALVRTTSALALSSPRPTVLLSRTYSVPDLSIYRPSLSSSYYYPYYSWRYWYPYRYRDYSLSDYSYNYPTYRSWFPYRSSYYSDYYTSPYYWNYPYSYWNRFKSYLYDYDWPYYSSRRQPTSMNCQTKYSNDPYYDSYIQSSRYRNSLLNSMEDGIHKGLALYRNGTISFDQLHRNWISSMSWHQRHKDWRQLYLWDKEQHRPSTQMEQKYTAEWVPAFNPA